MAVPTAINTYPSPVPTANSRKCAVGDRLVWLWFHQVVVNQLIGFWSYSQIAPKRTVKGEGHEDDQPYEHGQKRYQDLVQPHILDFEKEGCAQADDRARKDHGPHHTRQTGAHGIEAQAAVLLMRTGIDA